MLLFTTSPKVNVAVSLPVRGIRSPDTARKAFSPNPPKLEIDYTFSEIFIK